MTYQISIILFSLLTIGVLSKDLRIIGGDDVSSRAYPFVAAFRYINDYKVICGGSIISNRHVITTAQCITSIFHDIRHIRVYTGISPLEGYLGTLNEIENIFIHPEFTGQNNNDEMNLHDITVVKLTETLELNAIQNVIGLLNREVADDDSGYILGWGSVSYPTLAFPLLLQKAQMFIVSQRFCDTLLEFNLYDSQFCAHKAIGVGPCMGDSGIPFIIDGQLAGINSVSIPCARGAPDIFTRIHYHIDFIRDRMNY